MPAEQNVMIVSFDVPVETKHDRREYRVFHKYLKQSGYVLLHQSLYIKMIRSSSFQHEYRELRMNAPNKGNVLALPLTLNAFRKMTAIAGENFDFESFSEEILCF